MKKEKARIAIIFLLFLSFVLGKAQIKDEQVKIVLDTFIDIKETKNWTIHYPALVSIWENEHDKNSLDSILYNWDIQPEYYLSLLAKQGDLKAIEVTEQFAIDIDRYQCPDLPNGINILVRKENDSLNICLLKRHNSFIEKDISFSYHYESTKKWDNRKHPDRSFPAIKIKYPFCIDNKISERDIEFRLMPLAFGMTYNDTRVNQLPLSIYNLKQRKGDFAEYTFHFQENSSNINQNEGITFMIIAKDGNVHKDLYIDGKKYKRNYQLNDTVYLDEQCYRVDSISLDWQKAFITKIKTNTKNIEYLNLILFDKIKALFTEGKEYILLDFWGTWCAPCIEGLPTLKELYQQVSSSCDFVSICFDKPENFDAAVRIFKEKDIRWKLLFDNLDDYNNSICKKLNINTFPSFIIVNRSGEIIFRGQGGENIDIARKILILD
ncbi:TlpA disulfide reductase family protein [Dysgonomonas sp. 25]|uniref:TlpA family protein disulfide reductase n=1 Tax=Dysgonomonas sp. 25 TaxID=2302933 RepID=UPI0013D603FA|nr:TlpA disulfide reductase family protein [Dysgonomonas sp. 25]NDV67921.1 TlpA family protein disulfide reductase [Dysgonomonas sp. 25]